MNRLLFINWEEFFSVSSPNLLIICGTIVAIAIIIAIVYIISLFTDLC
jgi:hypothetical protein